VETTVAKRQAGPSGALEREAFLIADFRLQI
jgi:hypothetical protein